MNFSFDLLSQIASGSNMFSATEKKLSKYILANPEKVVSFSIGEVASECKVSVATVSRFCRRLSLNSYQEFRLELMKAISNPPPTLEGSEIPQDSSSKLILDVINVQYTVLQKAATALNPKQIELAVDYIEQARDVHFIGCGNMLLVAMSANHQFMQISRKFNCQLDPAFHTLSLSLVDECSVVIIYSYTGSTLDIIELAKLAKQNGAKVIAITRYQQSPLTEFADVIIICGVSEGPLQAGSSAVQIAMLCINEILFTDYYLRNPDESNINKKKTSSLVIGKINPLDKRKKKPIL